MKWTKTGLLLATLALGWWIAQRVQPALADRGDGTQQSSAAVDPTRVVTPNNPDPKMIITPKHNPDPKMVITPPWPPRDK